MHGLALFALAYIRSRRLRPRLAGGRRLRRHQVKMTGIAQPFAFKEDRPFLFTVRNATTGVIAFMGSVADPSATAAE
ncbi:serpin family protein [Paenibacillus glycinis]|uniref:Serpin domain-containing protein n=1 Tax=Paenibacillus glycinis TaxID=2697035 RepID=A0ABW9XW44_9BACL|nr:serpin family protein [Paenibacillus glycinis]NBD26915.1 hypothetical protein [Paenibacillus glycinis]